jgi:rRNA maturation protein Nop10
MEKEYREIKCIGLIEKNGNLTPCDKIIRFKVSEQNYGGTMEGKCPNCGQKLRVRIPLPVKTEDQSNQIPFNEPNCDAENMREIFKAFFGKQSKY